MANKDYLNKKHCLEEWFGIRYWLEFQFWLKFIGNNFLKKGRPGDRIVSKIHSCVNPIWPHDHFS